jgi:hypothetical protein
MRVSLTNCLLFFVAGWIGVIFFVYYFFDVFGSNSHALRNGFTSSSYARNREPSEENTVSELFSKVTKTLSFGNSQHSHDATLPPLIVRRNPLHHMPRYPPFNTSAYSTSKEDAMYIYLDWPVDDRLFTVDNYKALESLLSVYPNAIFRCLLATPREAFGHKIGNSLSFTQFIKYKKRQYNINMLPINVKQKSRTSSIGEKYRDKWYSRCCQSCNAACRSADHTQPYHLLNYIRLSHLWQNGGIFSDFSFFFLGPITVTEVQQVGGFFFRFTWFISLQKVIFCNFYGCDHICFIMFVSGLLYHVLL